MYSRLRGCSSLKMVGREMASRMISAGVRPAVDESWLVRDGCFSFKIDYLHLVNSQIILGEDIRRADPDKSNPQAQKKRDYSLHSTNENIREEESRNALG